MQLMTLDGVRETENFLDLFGLFAVGIVAKCLRQRCLEIQSDF